MKRQLQLKKRLKTLSALHDAVGAMRSLASHHFRRARQALADARAYRNEMDAIIAEIGVHQPLRAPAPPGLLVLASDLGLCGDYNSRLSRAAFAEAQQYAVQSIYSVGRRARGTLEANGLGAHRKYDAPASLEGLSGLLLQLSQDVLDDYLSLRIGGLRVVSAGFEGVGRFSTLSVQVLPIDSAPPDQIVRRSPYVDPRHLEMSAAREYLYITLYEVLLDALAAEHGMRLLAAESALDWLEDSTAATSRRLASARSEASTQELLDIIAGGRTSASRAKR